MKEKIKLEKGLVLVRYVAPSSGSASALIRSSIEPKDAAKGQIVGDPFASDNELSRPGQCFVVQCLSPLILLIDVQSTIEGELPRGSVRIEYLTRSANASRPARAETGPAISPQMLKSLKLQGHVAYRGDVTVSADEWLCGPESPNRIEGIKLVWPVAPVGLDIKYRASGGPVCQIGEYAGSKGTSTPITSLDIWCDGPLANRVSWSVEGLFVHGGVVAAQGQEVRLAGRSAKDELIGLKLSMALNDSVTEVTTKPPSKSRVVIFRD